MQHIANEGGLTKPFSKKYTNLVKNRGSREVGMPLFSAKLDYALRAMVDLAMQPPEEACQSREIAARQSIRGPYLDQILAILKREGIVRSIRGAGGGYALARPPHRITIREIVQAVVGNHLLLGSATEPPDPLGTSAAYVVRQFAQQTEERLAEMLERVTLADLVAQKQRVDESLSIMPSI
jgi:Rrf2 family iron-sulfur cluster assembly transcriptional regulator